MRKPPAQEPKQQDFVKTALRIPAALHDKLKEAAEQNCHSLNAEMLARLSTHPLEDIKRQNDELKRLVREVLNHVRS